MLCETESTCKKVKKEGIFSHISIFDTILSLIAAVAIPCAFLFNLYKYDSFFLLEDRTIKIICLVPICYALVYIAGGFMKKHNNAKWKPVVIMAFTSLAAVVIAFAFNVLWYHLMIMRSANFYSSTYPELFRSFLLEEINLGRIRFILFFFLVFAFGMVFNSSPIKQLRSWFTKSIRDFIAKADEAAEEDERKQKDAWEKERLSDFHKSLAYLREHPVFNGEFEKNLQVTFEMGSFDILKTEENKPEEEIPLVMVRTLAFPQSEEDATEDVKPVDIVISAPTFEEAIMLTAIHVDLKYDAPKEKKTE